MQPFIHLPVRCPAVIEMHPVWDPSSQWLALPADSGLAVVDLRAPSPRAIGTSTFRPRGVAWSPDGRTLAVAYDERDVQCLFDAADGKKLWQIAFGEPIVDDVIFSPDGQYIVFVGEEIVVCHAQTGPFNGDTEKPYGGNRGG